MRILFVVAAASLLTVAVVLAKFRRLRTVKNKNKSLEKSFISKYSTLLNEPNGQASIRDTDL